MRLYRTSALLLAAAFAAVGLVFLAAPGVVAALFDSIGRQVGARGAPPGDVDSGLLRALAVAYMYVVTLLAWMMYRRPAEAAWPTLLARAKLASAAISFLLVALDGLFLVYLINGIVDGAIGAAVLLLRNHALSGPGDGPVGGVGG